MKRLFLFMYLFVGTVQALLAHPDTLRIVAVGDIMMGSGFPTPILPKDDGKGSFKAVLVNSPAFKEVNESIVE
jgi:hypothetical protein